MARELKDVDVVIFCGGISAQYEGEEMPVELPGFNGGDRTDIELPASAPLFAGIERCRQENHHGLLFGFVHRSATRNAHLRRHPSGMVSRRQRRTGRGRRALRRLQPQWQVARHIL